VASATFLSFPFTNEYMQALNSTTYLPAQNFLAQAETTIATGVLSSKVSERTRSIGVPQIIHVTKKSTAAPNITSDREQILASTVSAKGKVIGITETMTSADPSALPAIALTRMLRDQSFKADAGQGVTAQVQALTLEGGKIRFVIKMAEVLPAPASTTIYRSFYLTYELQPAKVEKIPEPVAAAPSTQDVAERALSDVPVRN